MDLNEYTIIDLDWSPDGRFIFFSSWVKGSGDEIMRVSSEGGKPDELGISTPRINYLSLHPDGQRIAFSSCGPTQRPPEIWVMENFLLENKK